MAKDYRYYEQQSAKETRKWLEDALYDPDFRFIKTITNNKYWHGDENHVDKSKSETLDPVLSKEKTANSRFLYDSESDESKEDQILYNLTDTLIPVADKIAAWRFGDNTPSRLKITTVLESDTIVGSGYIYNDETHKVETRKTNAISIVLQKSTTNEYGIDAITAYPELQPNIQNQMKDRTVEYTKPGKAHYVILDANLIEITPNGAISDKTIEGTQTYQSASEKKMNAIKLKCQNIGKFMEDESDSDYNDFEKT